MKSKLSLRKNLATGLERLRIQSASSDALLQLSLAGLFTGIATGGVIVAFVLVVDFSLAYFLNDQPENFEGLNTLSRVLAPILGGLLLATLFHFFAKGQGVGIAHVRERLRHHDSDLTLRGFIMQFIGGSIALISGQSLGREGPSVHLGAALGSLFGKSLHLPHNTLRVLLACGSAGAIGAAFNTPLAGVIFAMEIIIAEYTVGSFVPIMISAVAATGISHWVLGNEPFLSIGLVPSASLQEIPFLLLLGILVGIAAASFIYIVRRSSEITANWNLFKRYSLAASITGFTAIFVPQVLGVGYDSLNQAILGQLSLATLIVILVMKLITSSISVGCGLPAGLIGPSFVIGAIGGSFMGLVLDQTLHLPVESSGLYAILGMAAMMGACLQAPLAALIAAFEITANPNIIWPSMLCIAVAQLVTRQVLKQGPVIDVILQSRGLNPVEDSLTQNLQRTGVSNIMNSDILTINAEQFASIRAGTLDISNEWLLLKSSTDSSISLFHQIDDLDKGTVVTRLSLIKSVAIDSRATLATARAYFRQYDVEVLHVINASNNAACLGVISRQQLSQYL